MLGSVLGPGNGGRDKINRNPCLVQCSRSTRGEIQFLNVSKYIICRLPIGGEEENRARRYTMLESSILKVFDRRRYFSKT